MFVKLGILSLALICGTAVAHEPLTEKCPLEDAACLKVAFQKVLPTFMGGIPDMGIEVMDIMEMDEVKFDLSGLQFSLKNGRLKGLKTSVIDNVKWDLKKKRLQVDYHVNTVVKGHYKASGRILILPITGDGDMKLKLKNVQISLFMDYETEKDANGLDHYIPRKYNFDFEVKDNANFNLTNLFNGNKQLSDTMLTFLNENWQQIAAEFGRPMMEVAAKKIFKNVVRFMTENPINSVAVV